MVFPAYTSREILDRIFSYSTALRDPFDLKIGTAYDNGDFLTSVVARNANLKTNLDTRQAITRVCRGWRIPALKYRYEFLVVDAKQTENWTHVNQTMETYGVGHHVKRLELDAFDSNPTRLKNAIDILKQCKNIRYISLTFADDTRRRLSHGDILLYVLRNTSASSLEQLRCNFGRSYNQTLFLKVMGNFPKLQTLHLHDAFGIDHSSRFLDLAPVKMAHLSNLELTTTKDEALDYLSECDLPSLRDVSIFRLHSVSRANRRFFVIHGHKIMSLELNRVVEGVSNLLGHCPNLEELILSLDGLGMGNSVRCPLQHSKVLRVGIRDIEINNLSVCKTMTVLDGVMERLTATDPCMFPRLWEIRLLDFHRSLLVDMEWDSCHVELWEKWTTKCEGMLIVVQAADGRRLSVMQDSFRIRPRKDDWLSLKY